MCVCVCVCVCAAAPLFALLLFALNLLLFVLFVRSEARDCVHSNACFHTSPKCFWQGSYTTGSAYCGIEGETSHVGRGASVDGGGPLDAIAIGSRVVVVTLSTNDNRSLWHYCGLIGGLIKSQSNGRFLLLLATR